MPAAKCWMKEIKVKITKSEDVHSIMVSDICSFEFSLNSSVRLSVFVKPKKKLQTSFTSESLMIYVYSDI